MTIDDDLKAMIGHVSSLQREVRMAQAAVDAASHTLRIKQALLGAARDDLRLLLSAKPAMSDEVMWGVVTWCDALRMPAGQVGAQ
jgi:hypothetical protein